MPHLLTVAHATTPRDSRTNPAPQWGATNGNNHAMTQQIKAKAAPKKADASKPRADTAAPAKTESTVDDSGPINPKIAAAKTDAGKLFGAVLPKALAVFVAPNKAGHLRDRVFRGSDQSSPDSMLRAAATLAAIAIYNGTTLNAIAKSGKTKRAHLSIEKAAFAMQSGAVADTVNRLGTKPQPDTGLRGAIDITPTAAKAALQRLPDSIRAKA